MGKLGKVRLTIESESLSSSVSATTYPVEKGSPITDHIQQKPQTLDLSGVIVGSNAVDNLTYLRDCMRKGKVLNYVGRTNAKNVLILDIQDNRTAGIKKGSKISIKLQYARFVKTSWRKKKTSQNGVSNSGKKQVTSTTNKTKYHTVKKGETYSHIAKKYGMTVSKLRNLNKWKDTSIPIGAKMKIL